MSYYNSFKITVQQCKRCTDPRMVHTAILGTSQKLLLISIHREEFCRHVQQIPGTKAGKASALASH